MKRTIALLLAVLMILCLAACGTPVPEAQTAESTEIANPWREITGEEAVKLCSRLFAAPEGAKAVSWHAMDGGKEGVGPLLQLDYRLAGQDFTARAQQGAAQEDDISGMYFEWGEPETVKLANWGEGNMEATIRRAATEDGNVVLCSWYDVEIGICYTLTTSDKDMPADFNIRQVAESMYNPANEPQIP